jgi:hypothetical protein
MLFSDIMRFYLNSDMKNKMVSFAKNREVIARYKEHIGSRPDTLTYAADIDDLLKKGATSFHASLERWSNPMVLGPGVTKREMDEIRIGWDLILDIDCKFLAYSKICADLICEAFEFHSIKNYSIKFSGGTGFHIGIPFESFPKEVNGTETAKLFPDGARIIAIYIKQMIKSQLADKILEFENIKDVSKRTGKTFEELVKDGEFDPYTVLDIDTIAISSRHLMRMPYSFNEKKWLVSVPIHRKDILSFKEEDAKPQNVKPELGFLDKHKENEAKQLFIQAFDWNTKEETTKQINEIKKTFDMPQEAIDPKFFPPCIRRIYEGLEDGRKRAIFVLINFLRSSGWSIEAIEAEVKKVNLKNKDQVSESYIKSQINWHKRLREGYLPPGCDNANYYKDLKICTPDKFCENIKNPVVYPLRKLKASKGAIRGKKE